jgi:hypothetical protein
MSIPDVVNIPYMEHLGMRMDVIFSKKHGENMEDFHGFSSRHMGTEVI